MSEEIRNMYARYRRAAGITQEKAAELLGYSTRSLQAWESGEADPDDDTVLLMCDIYGSSALAVEHMRERSQLARRVIPALSPLPLAQAVTQLLYAMRRFETAHRADDLIWISSNGQVDPGEQERVFEATLADLQDIVRAAMQLRIAQGSGRT